MKPFECPLIPESELWVTSARSSGPGGQNVNKRETKAVVRWHVDASGVLSEGEKQRIHERLRNRINGEGFLVIDNDETRYREQNRKKAIWLLQEMVRQALTPDMPRIPTKPSRAAKRVRLQDKRQQALKKAGRQKPSFDE